MKQEKYDNGTPVLLPKGNRATVVSNLGEDMMLRRLKDIRDCALGRRRSYTLVRVDGSHRTVAVRTNRLRKA